MVIPVIKIEYPVTDESGIVRSPPIFRHVDFVVQLSSANARDQDVIESVVTQNIPAHSYFLYSVETNDAARSPISLQAEKGLGNRTERDEKIKYEFFVLYLEKASVHRGVILVISNFVFNKMGVDKAHNFRLTVSAEFDHKPAHVAFNPIPVNQNNQKIRLNLHTADQI